MSKALLSDILRAIKRTFSRFISIVIIVALGSGFFAGFKSAAPSMSATAEEYFETNNLMDIRVLSPIGLTQKDVDTISSLKEVEGATGSKFVDALVLVNGQPEIDIDGSQISTRAYGINLNKLQAYYYGADDKTFINRPTLIEGTYPTKPNQCLVDASELSAPESYKIGNYIKLEADSNTDLSVVSVTEFEIVGIIRTPAYVSFERGNSLVGSGKIGTFIYIPENVFTTDYYSEIYVTCKNADAYETGSDEYYSYIDIIKRQIETIADSNVQLRIDELKKTLPAQIINGEREYLKNKEDFDKSIAEAEEKIAQLQKFVDDPNGAYNEAVKQAAEKLGLAENEFNGNTSEYYSAVETYNKNLEAYKAAKNTLNEKNKQLAEATNKYNQAERMLTTAQNSVTTAKQFVTSTQNVIDSTSSVLTSLEEYQNGKMDDSQISQILSTLQGINPDLYASISSLSAVGMATEAIALINPYLEQQKTQLAVYQESVDSAEAQLSEYQGQFEKAAVVLKTARSAYNASEAALNTAYDELNTFYTKLEGSKDALSMAQIELMLGQNEVSDSLEKLKTTITNAPAYLEQAKAEYNSVRSTYEAQLANAANKLENAKKLYRNLSSAKWNVYDRTDTPGYTSLENAIDNIKILSNLFPVIFFLVAALVCLTTMTRMVEEERTQMGTMKALGYSSRSIASKYLIYALFASIIGASLGVVLGVYVLPFAVYKAYSIMFTLPALTFTFPVFYIVTGVAISLFTTILATIIASIKELKCQPATLMRPKAPKPGKRVFLEHIGFIWKRLSFTSKVTTRNLFRRKSRFIMTVLGIGGCTALILGSMGFYSSVNQLMKNQFADDGIFQYDVQFVFDSDQTEDSAIFKMLKDDARIPDVMLSSMQSVTGGSDRTDKKTDVYLFVPSDSDRLSSFVKLKNRKTGEALKLNDTGAVITEQFAENTDTKIGDKIWIENADGVKVEIPVAAITENYTFSYVYVSENLYQYLFQEKVGYNYAVATVSPTILEDSKSVSGKASQKASFATELMAYDAINAVAYVSDTASTLDEVIGVLSIVIMIFVIAAGILAYIVLYNLNNINISERHRELATIRVLGFHDNELSAYIYRENIILTITGIALGMGLGVVIHKLFITYCAVDTVMYAQKLPWYCFIFAALLTAFFAIVVNAMMKKKMRKIDMVESLKAIE